MKYDFVCLGGGPLSHYFTTMLSKSDLKFLVVSDYSNHQYDNRMSYDSFLDKLGDFECSQMVIFSRFDRLKDDVIMRLTNGFRSTDKLKFGKVTFLSSVAVYPSTNRSVSEAESNPHTAYGRSKVEIEKKLIASLGNSLTVLRIANLYGAAGISKLEFGIAQFLKDGTPLRLPKSKVTRDFVYIDDLWKFFFVHSLKFPSGIFNFASGQSTSIVDFVNKWTQGFTLNLESFLEDPVVLESVISNLKFKKATNFTFTTLDVGIPLSRKAFL